MIEEYQQDTALINLPTGLCFYESRAVPCVDELGKLAEAIHRDRQGRLRGVLVIQPGPADDRRASWQAELEYRCLFGELVHRIDAWRWLLSMIRNSPIPWVYAAADNCQGSTWELALSCQRRLWFSTQAMVGFPEIAIGGFPPGGIIESLSKRSGRTRERWQGQPVGTAAASIEAGMLHFAANAKDWVPRAKAMFLEQLRHSPRAGVRDSRRKREKDDFSLVTPQSRAAALEQLDSVWQRERQSGAKEPSAWDYCWQLVKERAKLQQPGDLGRLIALIASRHLLNASYLAWIAAYRVVEQGVVSFSVTHHGQLPPIIIDLNHMTPPTAVLVRLLQASCRIVLVAGEAKDLAVGISLLGNRLERALGAAPMQALWDRNITWFQAGLLNRPDEFQREGSDLMAGAMLMRWAVDDRFLLSWQGKNYEFLRVEGNTALAGLGLLERPMMVPMRDQIPSAVAVALGLIADGLIATQAAIEMPLTMEVRWRFLYEMVTLSRNVDGDLGMVTEALRASGWRFAADDDAWDRFVRNYHEITATAPRNSAPTSQIPADTTEDSVGGGGDPALGGWHSAIWEIGSWKHAKLLARRQAGIELQGRKALEGPPSRWNPTRISQHLMTYLGLLATSLLRECRVSEAAAVDHLCLAALGVPVKFGTPMWFLRHLGRRRAFDYARRYWPQLNVVGEGGGDHYSNAGSATAASQQDAVTNGLKTHAATPISAPDR